MPLDCNFWAKFDWLFFFVKFIYHFINVFTLLSYATHSETQNIWECNKNNMSNICGIGEKTNAHAHAYITAQPKSSPRVHTRTFNIESSTRKLWAHSRRCSNVSRLFSDTRDSIIIGKHYLIAVRSATHTHPFASELQRWVFGLLDIVARHSPCWL